MLAPKIIRAEEIQRAIRDVLMQEWDPLGVKEKPEAAGEYDGYTGRVFRLLSGSRSDAALIQFLMKTEAETMKLGAEKQHKREELERLAGKLRDVDILFRGPSSVDVVRGKPGLWRRKRKEN